MHVCLYKFANIFGYYYTHFQFRCATMKDVVAPLRNYDVVSLS